MRVTITIKVILKLLKRHLVSILEDAIGLRVFLDCVVSQVNILIIRVIWIDAEFT